VFYNFVRMHKTLRMSPAMAAGATDKLMSMEDIPALVDAVNPVSGKRGPYKAGANRSFSIRGMEPAGC
jgi:hypothetical protein